MPYVANHLHPTQVQPSKLQNKIHRTQMPKKEAKRGVLGYVKVYYNLVINNGNSKDFYCKLVIKSYYSADLARRLSPSQRSPASSQKR